MTHVIEVAGLSKTYQTGRGRPALRAVDAIDFRVREGEVFGFLGPNGAGKTTTIRMLTGLTRPTSGQARLLGLDLIREAARIKKQIGVVPEVSNLYDELSAFDNLIFSMQLYGVPRAKRRAQAEELLARFRLSERADTPFGRLSRGMKRALTIAAALAHRPAIVFLDEPTTGLDVMTARGLRQMIAGLREEGVTVFLTTHYLEEAERLCDRVAILVQGRIVALDSVERLKARASVGQGVTVEVTVDGPQGPEAIRCAAGGVEAGVQKALTEAGGRRVLSIRSLHPSLEEVFVSLTGLSADLMLVEKGSKGPGNANG